MSDSEEFLSEESYEFEFEDDDGSEPEQIEEQTTDDQNVEVQYYNAKAYKDEDTKLAILKLHKISTMDINSDNVIWMYKSNKQIAKIHYSEHELDECLNSLNNLLKLVPHIDDKQYLDDSLNKIFINYGNIKNEAFRLTFFEFILSFIDITGNRSGNDRTWIKCNLNKFSILLSKGSLEECSQIILLLNEKLVSVSDITRNAFILEVIASEIELLSLYKSFDATRLNYLYKKSINIISPVTHPRIMGVIKQCGGRLEFLKGHFDNSRINFYDSFKSFDECGSTEKDKTFKYLILLSIITENEFNPFESQETQHYAQFPDFQKLLMIIECVNELDLDAYKEVVLNPGDDSFFQDSIVIQSVRIIHDLIIEKVMLNFFKSYSTLTFEKVQKSLSLKQEEFEEILLKLGASGKLSNVNVNFFDKVIESTSLSSKEAQFPPALDAKQVLTNSMCLLSIRCLADPNTEENMNVDEQDEQANLLNNSWNSSEKSPLTSSRQNTVLRQLILILPRKGIPLELVESWLRVLKNSLPKPFKYELSTKEQIFTEQRLGHTNPDIVAQLQNNQINKYDPQEKIRLLQGWTKDLLANLNQS